MGAYLSTPVTEKEFENGEDDFLSFVTCSMQGWRTSQEDSHSCIIDFDNDMSLFGVYDGHGGSEVAKLSSSKLPEVIRNSKKFSMSNFSDALTESFLSFDESILSSEIQSILKTLAKSDDSEVIENENNEQVQPMSLSDIIRKYDLSLIENDSEDELENDTSTEEINDEEIVVEKSVTEDEEKETEEDNVEESEDDNESNDETVDSENQIDEDEEIFIKPSLKRSFQPTSSTPGFDSGCTAVVSLIDRKNMKIYVANAGDSRCVICRDGHSIDLSIDHKPEDDIERLRITQAGGMLSADGRVNGGLNLSRALGDHNYKKNKDLDLKDQMISSFPDVQCLEIRPLEDEFMVLACDGIWNTFSSEELVEFVKKRIDVMDMKTLISEIFSHCLAPNTCGDGTGCDNMTCTIISFKNFSASKHSKGDATKRKLEIEDCNPAKVIKTC